MDSRIAIVDCHHHLWDLSANYYPWLTDQITTRVCGEYAAIRRDYLLDDFLSDAEGVNLVKSVHVQAEHDRSDPVRETRWLQSVADAAGSSGFPHAIIAYADFMQNNVAQVLEAHCAFPNVRGIRQMLHESHVDLSNPRPCLLEDTTWLHNFAVIEEFQLSFDLQIYFHQAPAACQLIRDHPDVTFILCHMVQPADRSLEAMQAWKRSLTSLAELPNTVIKISGVGMFDHNWTQDSLRPIVMSVIDAFGIDRCMFGSNFPVDGMMSDYQRLWSAFHALVSDFSLGDRQSLFGKNADRFYRI
jgi:predicted TIM-barrel fold metal-dependent hydrolase